MKDLIGKLIREELNNFQNDYSGEYEDLYNFINDNNLQQIFVDKYKQFDDDLTIDNWEDFVRGEMGYDEDIIKELLGNNYRLYYDNSNDVFIITKKKEKNKLNYKIILSSDEKILDEIGVYSEYKPRFGVIVKNNIVGGSTYYIDDDNIYNFDLGISEQFQGYGISTKLINYIINDAKKLKTNGLKAQVVNDMLFNYLINNGFQGSNDSGIKYVYKYF